MGVLRFSSVDHKEEFRTKLRERKYKTTFAESQLYIDNNYPKEDRPKRRAAGKVKRALMEKDGSRQDVVVMRDKGEVW
eukprot:4113778-Karenia_brevis.AAC.1